MMADGSGRRVRSHQTWTAARSAYLDGLSAAEVCARFDLGLSSLRARARREGWRRADQADPDPDLAEHLDEELEADGPADFIAMRERAARLAARALAEGDLRRAEGWTRLHLRLEPLEHAARVRAYAAAPRPTEPPDTGDEVHSVHLVHPDSECTSPPGAAPEPPPSTRPSNRADRRRQARLAAHQAAAKVKASVGQGP